MRALGLALVFALTACSSSGPTACEALTCAMGCCAEDGTCVKPPAQSDARCGGNGVVCTACAASEACAPGAGCASLDGGP